MKLKQVLLIIILGLLSSCGPTLPTIIEEELPTQLNLVFIRSRAPQTSQFLDHFKEVQKGLQKIGGKDTTLIHMGDALFPSLHLPPERIRSLKWRAQAQWRTMESLGVSYYIPGEKDFAMGIEGLEELVEKAPVFLLLSNFANEQLPHKKWVKLETKDTTVFVLAVLAPELAPKEMAMHFSSAQDAVADILQKLKRSDEINPDKKVKLALVIHGGQTLATSLAKNIPELDWIIAPQHGPGLWPTGLTEDAYYLSAKERAQFMAHLQILSPFPPKLPVFNMQWLKDTPPKVTLGRQDTQLEKFIQGLQIRLNEIEKQEGKELSKIIKAKGPKVSPIHPEMGIGSCLSCHGEIRSTEKRQHPKGDQCLECHSMSQDHPFDL